MSTVIILVDDVDRLLRLIYNGTRPPGVRMLLCSCGRSANLTEGDAAWLGWQVLPHPMCPGCLHPEPYDGPARDVFMQRIAKGR
jgi:hypothetical protein